MIDKGKNLQFFSWTNGGKLLQVVGQKNSPSEPTEYSFFFDKKKVDNQKELTTLFLKELAEQSKQNAGAKARYLR